MTAPRHVAALDGLRALAVIAVVAFHTRPHAPADVLERALDGVTCAGWIGVDLFFVLSGFLITGILLDARDKPRYFRNFYVRRTLRIFPIYYALLAIVVGVLPHLLRTDDPGVQRILGDQAWLWCYGTNLDVARHGGLIWHAGWLDLTHLWSLAVEEQFYLVWPLLVYLAPRRVLVAVSTAIVIGAPILRIVLLHAGASPDVVYELTLTRLDPLAVGALLAVLVRVRPEAAPRVARTLAAIGGAALAGIAVVVHHFELDDPLVQQLGFSALAACFGGVVLAATLSGRTARALARPALVTIGRYSYAIYLFHGALLPLYRWLYARAGVPSGVLAEVGFMAFVLAASTALAALSYHAFERHFLALKDRLAPASATSPVVSCSDR